MRKSIYQYVRMCQLLWNYRTKHRLVNQCLLRICTQLNESEHQSIPTTPCKIVVRKLDANDINLWKPKPGKCAIVSDPDTPLPATPIKNDANKPSAAGSSMSAGTSNTNTPANYRIVSGYGLRNRPKPTPRGRHGPSRVSKSNVTFKGVFSSEERQSPTFVR